MHYFKQSQVINLSIYSQIPSPVALFIQIYFLLGLALSFRESKIIFHSHKEAYQHHFLWQTNNMIKAVIYLCFNIFSFILFSITNSKWNSLVVWASKVNLLFRSLMIHCFVIHPNRTSFSFFNSTLLFETSEPQINKTSLSQYLIKWWRIVGFITMITTIKLSYHCQSIWIKSLSLSFLCIVFAFVGDGDYDIISISSQFLFSYYHLFYPMKQILVFIMVQTIYINVHYQVLRNTPFSIDYMWFNLNNN